MLSNSIRLLLITALVSAVAYGGIVVDRWHRDSVKLEKLMPLATKIDEERLALADQVTALNADKSLLKQAISEQNHALELAQAETDKAKALQAQALTFAAKDQQRSTRRIAELEADLADTTKTLTDMLDNSWRQPR